MAFDEVEAHGGACTAGRAASSPLTRLLTACDLRIAGLALLTVVTLKVFLIDAAALKGILRILSLLGRGVALLGIGWAYGRIAPAQSRMI